MRTEADRKKHSAQNVLRSKKRLSRVGKQIIFSRSEYCTGKPASSAGAPDRAWLSDLVKLCLPQEFRNSNRKLAWINSICLLFLLVGVVGLKSPRGSTPPTYPVMDSVVIPAGLSKNQKCSRGLRLAHFPSLKVALAILRAFH